MCGILGAVGLPEGQPSPAAVNEALRRLHHRGPEGRGFVRSGSAALGHTRLRVIDLSEAGAQPMSDPDGSVIVTFNGEIYNHRALRRELTNLGFSFRSRSDTEVLVHGYRAWGEDLLGRLDGMFAFAVWDARAQQLLLARDRAGEKPLFYAYDEAQGVLRFASEIKALVPLGVPLTPRPQGLTMLLSFGYNPAPHTLYQGISQLPPATALRLRVGQAPHLWSYWQPSFAAEPKATLSTEARERVRSLVIEAVRSRLESDVALGAFLSGGLDSSIIVGVLARILKRRVKTFSIGFSDDARFDETRYAREAARAFGTEHTEFTVHARGDDQPRLIEELVWLHDGPFGDSSAIPTYLVAKLTREHVTVALTGDGGDELFCGYPRFLAAEASEYLPGPLLRIAQQLTGRLPSGGSERSLRARAQRFLSAAALPLSERVARWSSMFQIDREARSAAVDGREALAERGAARFAIDLPRLFRPEWRERLDLDEPLRWQRACFAAQPESSPLARTLDNNFRTYLPYDLLIKVDRTAMAHALETRAPFLAHDLIHYAASLPDSYRRRGLQQKRILREAFADLLPPIILRRGKMGFGVPVGTWFRRELRDYLQDHLGRGARLHQYLDPAIIDALLREHQSGRADHSHRLWTLLTLEVWLRALPRWSQPCA